MPDQTFHVRVFFRVLLGLILAAAGITHLTVARTEFLAQVPDWVPVEKDLTVLLSGIVEIILGVLLTFWKSRQQMMGWIVALFFIAVFPGNLHQYKSHIDAFSLNTDHGRLIRLFFQPVLVTWALWSTGVLWKRNGR